ncbi:MAG: glycosyltransferase family 4 protein [Motiliproteus sp.]|nr:glycosyltransferase family 4 protein [Motiliproteus sp.]MCW9052381.1 glycosyltransferase family 4 protein [Motiliproteus sp.]
MKIGFISYPMLFQRNGGLQIQIRETLLSLRKLGVDANIVDPLNSDLSEYDILHVFSINHGNHNIINTAKEKGCKVILSPLAEEKWTESIAKRCKLIDKIIGKFTNYLNYSFYSQAYKGIQNCDHIIALGNQESLALSNAFDVRKEKISIIENGVPERFFSATPNLFYEKIKIDGEFILCVGSINENKNQLTLSKALSQFLPDLKLVLIGHTSTSNKDYLNKVLENTNVIYLGPLDYDDPLLESAYTAASIFALPSFGEVFPLSSLESLASGTPVIMTKNSSMKLKNSGNEFLTFDPSNAKEISNTIKKVLRKKPDSEQCRNIVYNFRWDIVAKKLLNIYSKLDKYS